MKKQQDKHERINQLLDELAKIGSNGPDDDANRWQSIGHAICAVTDNVRGVYQLANEVAEDWNCHGWKTVVDFITGNGAPRSYMLPYLENAFNKTVKLADSGKTVKISLTIEEIDEA